MTRKGLHRINICGKIVFCIQMICMIISIVLIASGIYLYPGVILLFAGVTVFVLFGIVSGSISWWMFFEKEASYSSVIHKNGDGIRQVFSEIFIYRQDKETNDNEVITYCRLHWMTLGVALFHIFVVIAIFMIKFPENIN